MPNVSMNELKKTSACQVRRDFLYELNEKPTLHFMMAVVMKRIIHDCLHGRMFPEDVNEAVKAAFKDLEFSSEKQRDVRVKDAAKQIIRYVDSENRMGMLTEGTLATVMLGQGLGLSVTLKPDFVSFDSSRKTIEVIKICCSKPNVSQRGASSDLGLYAMYRYGVALVPAGESFVVKASYYFLRKDTDRNSYRVYHFSEDFFSPEGNNVVSLEAKYTNRLPGDDEEEVVKAAGKTEKTKQKMDVDTMFASVVSDYLEGIPEEECSKKDCEVCQLFDVCKYTASPKAIKKATAAKSLADLSLTPDQEAVIEFEHGVLRVNAGAGAGKTAVVALRTAVLINKGYDRKKMLLITFTNAGAEEMRSRIRQVLVDFGIDDDVSDMSIMTFNAFGDMIIRREYKQFGFTEEPKLVDDIERSRIIADIINTDPIDGLDYRNFTADLPNCKGALTVAKEVFYIVKAGQYSIADVKKVIDDLGNTAAFSSIGAIEELIRRYDQFDETLRRENLIEYSDQEALVFELLNQDPYYLENFGFEHIIVDEFQDSNEGQINLIKLLRECPSYVSLMVVGDDSQAIFSFRNTSPYYMIHFDEIMGCTVEDICLKENHRSTPEILDFANQINATRTDRLDKDLIATRPHGEPVIVQGFLTKDEERAYIVNGIKAEIAAGRPLEDIAIIAATKDELLEFADLLGNEGIATVLLNPEPLAKNSRVRAAIALTAFLRDPSSTKDALIYANALAGGGLKKASMPEVQSAMSDMKALADGFFSIPDEPGRKARLIELLKAIDDDDEVYQSFVKTLSGKSVQAIYRYCDDFYEFGSEAAYRRDHSYPGVALSTAHSSKGLEWPCVFNSISKYDTEQMNTHSHVAREATEERKRLFFVSATRARDKLVVTGLYVAFGKKGDYHYNRFLMKALELVGKEISAVEVEKMRLELEEKKLLEKKLAKEKEKEEKKKALKMDQLNEPA